MIADWKAAMKKEPTPRLFREVTQAFKAAVATTKGEGGAQCRYKVADSSGRTPCLICELKLFSIIALIIHCYYKNINYRYLK